MSGVAPSISHFSLDDRDLDDAELWAVIDSAAASNSSSCKSRKPLALKNSHSPNSITVTASSPSPLSSKSCSRVGDVRAFRDGEVVQEVGGRTTCRPHKMARFLNRSPSEEKRVVVVTHPVQSPRVSFPFPYSHPETSPRVETSPHSLSGQFPSVSLFKQYQNAAMAILEKSDYTTISGNPFIKKSGWRKISFYFNLSFEIKDKLIEFDDNRNVLRSEFVVRAYMQGGRFSDGWGSCERCEKRFLKPNHDIPSTAETRAKNKACQDLLGIGQYQPGAGSTYR